ncbi:hypothetical protein GCM10010522_30540 [Kribbella solani]
MGRPPPRAAVVSITERMVTAIAARTWRRYSATNLRFEVMYPGKIRQLIGSSNRATDRATERLRERTTARAGDWAGGRLRERATGRADDCASGRLGGRASGRLFKHLTAMLADTGGRGGGRGRWLTLGRRPGRGVFQVSGG